jgi:hypothetical protein
MLNIPLLWQYMVDLEAALAIVCKYLLPGAHIIDFLPFRMAI